MADLTALQQVLGVSFDDQSHLEQALVHSSYINENPGSVSNERLEFMGDAVLGFIVAEKLYNDFPDLSEGESFFLQDLQPGHGGLSISL